MPSKATQIRRSQLSQAVRRMILVTSFAVLLVVRCPWVIGQEAVTAAPESPPSATVSATEIDEALSSIDESQNLDDVTKSRLKDLYGEAKIKLQEFEEKRGLTTSYESRIEGAEQEVTELQQQLAAQPDALSVEEMAETELPRLTEILASKRESLATAKEELKTVQAEPQRRLRRRSEIPGEVTAAEAELAQIEAQLEAIESSEDPAAVTEARKAVLLARRNAAEAALAALKAERAAYDAEGELPRLQADAALAAVRRLDQEIETLQSVIAQKKMLDAREQKDTAQEAFESAPAYLKPFARRLIAFAQRRLDLTDDLRIATEVLQKTTSELRFWEEDFAKVQRRAEAANTTAIGRMLLERQAKLPSPYSLRDRVARIELPNGTSVAPWERELRDLGEFQRELFDLEDRRAALSDIEGAAVAELAEIFRDAETLPEGAREELRSLLEFERSILDSLLEEAHRLYTLRIDARQDQRELEELVSQYRAFVSERILWLRTAELRDFEYLPEAFWWILDPQEWTAAVAGFPRRFLEMNAWHQLQGIGLLLLLLLSLRFRQRARAVLRETGQIASGISCHSIRPTVRTVALTAVLAAPGVLLLFFAAWMFAGAPQSVARFSSLSFALVGVCLLNVEFLRQSCRPMGLADAHFDWPTEAISVARRNLRLLIVLGLPLTLLWLTFHRQQNFLYQASAGRLCLVLFLLLSAYILHRIFRPHGGILSESGASDSVWRFDLARTLFWLLVIAVPLTLAALALRGFSFTAYRITVDLWRALEIVLVLWITGAILFRWVWMARRRYRRKQLLDARRQGSPEADSDSKDVDELVANEEKVDLATMDHQTRSLIRTVLIIIGLAALWATWLRELSALAPLLQSPLWDVDVGGGEVRDVTVGAVLLAGLLAVFAILASKNVPGVVDVMLLGKLGIESSTRYAISTIFQYVIVIGGVLFAAGLLGISWDRAQWLVAALGVGLGFGLQEVVANFVSGILLLFERPIRVGDLVTLGDTTGTVIRIRSRATTVRNWDRQEVVIPNKDLITGRITNWTLTDDLNRITIQVGVAYGADIELATDLLQQISAENLNVLVDPKPLVTFEAFGDSTLLLVLRAYLADIDSRLSTIHELHLRINRRFQEEGIEIAFPQRDLHIRSIDPSISLAAKPDSVWQESGDSQP